MGGCADAVRSLFQMDLGFPNPTLALYSFPFLHQCIGGTSLGTAASVPILQPGEDSCKHKKQRILADATTMIAASLPVISLVSQVVSSRINCVLELGSSKTQRCTSQFVVIRVIICPPPQKRNNV